MESKLIVTDAVGDTEANKNQYRTGLTSAVVVADGCRTVLALFQL